jgi:DNA-directed RNA polymerases I, II, and III subunit RPABC2
MSDLEEISNEELLSDVDGSIELSEVDEGDNISSGESDKEEIFEDDGDKSELNDSEKEDDDSDDDPWILDSEIPLEAPKSDLIKLSDDEDDDSDYDEEELKKLEKSNNKEILINYHPETKQINYKELDILTKITRNKTGMIIDPLHTTIPILTRYEKTKILGLRAKQINNGSNLFIQIKRDVIDGHVIALMELEQKKIPFIIRRPLPNGQSEYWNVKDLEIIF